MRNQVLLVVSAACIVSTCGVSSPACSGTLKTQVVGTSTSSGVLSRTITDISQPPPRPQTTYFVSCPIGGAGVSASAVATALRDAINSQIGGSGFSATFTAGGPDTAFVDMTTPAGVFSTNENNTVHGTRVVTGDHLVLARHMLHVCGSSGLAAEPLRDAPGAGESGPLGATGVPSPTYTSTDGCLHTCPAGDLPFHATLRDANNATSTTGTLILDFSSCASFPVCGGSSTYSVDVPGRQVWTTSNSVGQVTLPIRMGGGCTGQVILSIDSGVLGTKPLASPDQNGDLMVTGDDMALLAAKVGTNDLTGDLDCDGAVSGSTVTGIDDWAPAIRAFTLRALWPNLLRPGELAMIVVQLPRSADLSWELFDVVGRKVAGESMGAADPGPRQFAWRVPDVVRPGLYSLRLRTGAGERDAKRLIIR